MIELEIEVASPSDGKTYTATVNIITIGGRVACEVRCLPSPPADVLKALETAIQLVLKRETGRNAVSVGESVRCANDDQLHEEMRKFFGGGKG